MSKGDREREREGGKGHGGEMDGYYADPSVKGMGGRTVGCVFRGGFDKSDGEDWNWNRTIMEAYTRAIV